MTILEKALPEDQMDAIADSQPMDTHTSQRTGQINSGR
jgi:hypothetical protein